MYKEKMEKKSIIRITAAVLCLVVAFSMMPMTGSLFGVAVRGEAKAAGGQEHDHKLSHVAACEPDCKTGKSGNTEYWYCSICDLYFSDSAGKYEMDESETIIPASHVFGSWEKTDENEHSRKCKNCGKTETEKHVWKKTAVKDSRNHFVCEVCNAEKENQTDETISAIEINVDYPKCGESVVNRAGGYTNGPRVSVPANASYKISEDEDCFWCDDKGAAYTGRLTGGHKYYASILLSSGKGYTFARSLRALGSIMKWQYDGTVKVNGNEVTPKLTLCFEKQQTVSLVFPVTMEHTWDEGKVTKETTTKAEGVRTFTCTGCGEKRTESIPKRAADRKGADGTDYGKGADLAVMEAAMLALSSEKDPAGTTAAPLLLKAKKETKKSITLTWKKQKKTARYIVYGTKCSKKNKMKRLAETTVNKMTVRKITKKLKKATYYKFMVAALDENDEVISTSKMIHAATKGSIKACNISKLYVKVKVKKKKKEISKLKVRSGSSRTLKVTGKKPVNGIVVRHAKVRYEISDPNVASVDGKGRVTGIKKGSCTLYVYAQNGMVKVLPVTVI